MSGQVRLSLIERESPDLSITQQCALMGIGPGLFSSPYACGYDRALSGLRALM